MEAVVGVLIYNMNIIRFVDSETSTQTYLIYLQSKNALIIDPVLADVSKYLEQLHILDLNLIYSLDTHIHADHITATGQLKNRTGCKIVMGSAAKIDLVDLKLVDQESLELDDLKIIAIHTPGHTAESCCYLINDRLFTGDCLLINACGRTDFQNGDAAEQYNSIFHKLLKLPNETIIYPAHDYNKRTISTIGEEKANNPRLQVKSVTEFVNMMNSLNLPKPKFIDVAVPRNMVCGFES